MKTIKTLGVILDPINIKNGIPKFRLALTQLKTKNLFDRMGYKDRTKSPGSEGARSPSVNKTKDSKENSLKKLTKLNAN